MPGRREVLVVFGMMLAGPALAQTAQAPLPVPALDENAPPKAFIDAALRAIAAGRTGEAQEAIERAESRALIRSVKPSQAGNPSQQPLVQQLSQARQALAAGDRMRAVTILQAAAQSPQSSAN